MPARPDQHGEPESIAVLGVPRKIPGRRAYPELSLVFSTFHLPLDVAVYAYLRDLGKHHGPKYPGVPSLCKTFHVPDRTMRRSLERLATPYADLHPAYISRSRAGRRKGQTVVTTVHRPGLTLEVPGGLLRDVTTRMLNPRDFQVWCAVQDFTSKPDADDRRPPDDGLLRHGLTDVLAALGSTNTSNPRNSFLYRSVRRLESVGWLVVATKAGADHLIAVPLQRLDRDERHRIAATLNAARPALLHTRHRHDRLSLVSVGTNPPVSGEHPPSDVDNPVDNPPATLHSRHRADRPTRHRDDRAKEYAVTGSTWLLKDKDQDGGQPASDEPTAGPPDAPGPRPVDPTRPPLVPVLPLIPRPRSGASAGRSRAKRRRSTPRHLDP